MTNIETQAKTAFGRTLHYVTDPQYAEAYINYKVKNY